MSVAATRPDGAWQLALPLAAVMLAFFVAPLGVLIAMSLHADGDLASWSLAQYAKFLGDGFNLRVLAETLWLGAKATLVCLAFGYPLAWPAARATPRVRSALLFVIVLPILTSVVVRTFSWIVILGQQGVLNKLLLASGLIDEPLKLLFTETGVVMVLAQVQLPLVALPLLATLSRIDPNLASASAALGAGGGAQLVGRALAAPRVRRHRGRRHRVPGRADGHRAADVVHEFGLAEVPARGLLAALVRGAGGRGPDPGRRVEQPGDRRRDDRADGAGRALRRPHPPDRQVGRRRGPMPGLSIHVVDVSTGTPAAGMRVEVVRIEHPVGVAVAEGRVTASGAVDLGDLDRRALPPGVYEVRFHAGDHYRAEGVALPEPAFLDIVPFRFGLADPRQHYHLPLKLTPWGFSLFRGGA